MGSFLPQISFRWWKEDGTVAYNWTAAFYGAGLDPIPANLKEIYSDLAQTTPIANPAAFDVEGKVAIVLGSGGYKLVIRDETDVVKYTLDNILGGGGFGTGFGSQFVDTIADLKALDAGSSAFCYVAGYFAALDGGHHMFRWNGSASTADNGGSVISPDSAPTLGRWEWVPDEGDYIRAKAFGVIPDGSTDRSARLLIADAYAASVYKKLLIEGSTDFSTLNISGAVALTARIVELTPGFILEGTATLSFTGYFEGGHEYRFATGITVTFAAHQISDAPEQFNAVVGATDNKAALDRWIAAGGGALGLPPGDWNYVGTWVEPSLPIRYLGRVITTVGASRGSGFNFPSATSRGRIGIIETSYGIVFTEAFPAVSISPFGDGLETDAALFTFNHAVAILEGLDVTGSATALNVIGTNSVHSYGDVVAGSNGAGGEVLGRAGTAAKLIPCGGQYAIDTGDYTTSGTTLETLGSATLLADSLRTAGERLRITVGGTFTGGSAQLKSMFVELGAVNIASVADNTIENGEWQLVIDLWITAAGFKSLSVLNVYDTSSGATSSRVGYTSDVTIDFTVNQTVSVKAQAFSSGSITQNILGIEYFPAPQ